MSMKVTPTRVCFLCMGDYALGKWECTNEMCGWIVCEGCSKRWESHADDYLVCPGCKNGSMTFSKRRRRKRLPPKIYSASRRQRHSRYRFFMICVSYYLCLIVVVPGILTAIIYAINNHVIIWETWVTMLVSSMLIYCFLLMWDNMCAPRRNR